LIAGMEGEGCGCEMCESKERARFAPAESPVRRILEGAIERFWRTCVRRREACWS
jgi:hypothetical protein